MAVVDQKSIVVVGEPGPALDAVAGALERDGYAVVPCSEVGRAHAVVRATMPDLVMLDSRGATATNWHASAMLKLDAQTSAIPVLLCPAEDPDHPALTARADALACSILVTPFEPADLLARIRELLG